MDQSDWSDLMDWDCFDPVYEFSLLDEISLYEMEVDCETNS
jgi:hypothetical protein